MNFLQIKREYLLLQYENWNSCANNKNKREKFNNLFPKYTKILTREKKDY